MSATPTSLRPCRSGCGNTVPPGRRGYCSDRCSDTVRKRRWRANAGNDDRTHPEAAAAAAVALAATLQRRATAAAQAERDMSVAVEEAARMRAALVAAQHDLAAAHADARALALIVRRVFELRDWRGYDQALRAVVDRHADQVTAHGQEG